MTKIASWYKQLSTAAKAIVISLLLLFVASITATGVLVAVQGDPDDVATPIQSIEPEPEAPEPTPVPANCQLKGSVTLKGEKIYQRPGDEFYNHATLDPARGERMFCSDAEAQAAGWQHGSLPPAPADECDTYKTREDASVAGKQCDTLPSKNDIGEIGEPLTE